MLDGGTAVIDARMAENAVRFRAAKERIGQVAEDAVVESWISFRCECAEQGCEGTVLLELGEYAAARTSPRFFTAPRHAIVQDAAARVVRVTNRYVLSERAGAVEAPAAASRRRRHGRLTVAPILVRPLTLGCAEVVESVVRFVGG